MKKEWVWNGFTKVPSSEKPTVREDFRKQWKLERYISSGNTISATKSEVLLKPQES